MHSDRRLGWLVVLAGAAVALAVQLAAPVGIPLYDGVPTNDAYRYLHPTSGQPGDPTSFTADQPVVGGASPAFAAATSENPPQAQLIAQTGAFTLTPGATSIHVSITAVDPPGAPPAGITILGNLYEVSVTDQAGTALAVATCDGCLSLSIRAPDGTDATNLELYAGGKWTALDTVPAGVPSMYQSNPTALGDMAVVSTTTPTGPTGPGTPTPEGVDPVVIFGVGAVGLWLLVFGFIVWQRVRPVPQPGVPGRGRRGIPSKQVPSKQRPPRRPGSGSKNP